MASKQKHKKTKKINLSSFVYSKKLQQKNKSAGQ